MPHKSVQGTSRGKPPPEHNDIMLVLHCVTCGTLRAFSIRLNLTAFEARLHSAFGIQADCNVCHRTVGVTLCWGDKQMKHFSFLQPPVLDAFQAHDEVAMQAPHITTES